MRRPVTALFLTAVAAIPAACSSATTSPSPAPSPAPTGTAPAASGQAGGSRTITGPAAYMQWGTVQVTIVVKGKRLTDAQASAPMERPRSAFINQQAVPWLRQETLQAQSANIDLISGATLTSEAYIQSLQGALDQAHI